MPTAIAARTVLTPLAADPRRRLAWLALALLCLGAAALAGAARGADIWLVVVFLIAPDLSFVAGLGQPAAHGQLAPRAVPVYNLVHRPLGPLALVAAAVFGLLPPWGAVAGLAWLAHISIDRTVGFGLRAKDGWQRA